MLESRGQYISESIGNLSALVTLNLRQCAISSTVPATIGNLANLQSLDLNSNLLAGAFPDTIRNCLNLTAFTVANNMFTSFPASMSTLPLLKLMDISSSHGMKSPAVWPQCPPRLQNYVGSSMEFVDFQPSADFQWLCGCRYLKRLELSGMAGPFPEWLGRCLPQLTSMTFNYHSFVGTLPNSICFLNQLTLLKISYGSLIGPIPSCISNLTKLTMLDFQRNMLESTIPDVFNAMPDLGALSLNSNRLIGTIPSSLSNSQNLVSFYADSNMLNGTLDGICLAPTIFALVLENNQFSGTLPSACSLVQSLFVSNNQLSGTISPSWFASGLDLYSFVVSHNRFNGTLPSTIPNQLSEIQLNGNQFEGTIPSWLCTADFHISIVNFAENRLHGTIPSCLGNKTLRGLIVLNISRNALSGTIPDSLGHINNLTFNFLDLHGNQLEGAIPQSLAYLSALHFLDLSDNRFTGSPPTQLTNIQPLARLDLSGNQFSGSLDRFFLSPRYLPAYLNVSHNKFEGVVGRLVSDNCNVTCLSVAILDARGNHFDCPIPDYNQLDILFLRDQCYPPYITFAIYSSSLVGAVALFMIVRYFLLRQFGVTTVVEPTYAPSTWRWWLFGVLYVASLVTLVSDVYTMWVIGQYLLSRIDNCLTVNSFSVWKSIPALAGLDILNTEAYLELTFPHFIYKYIVGAYSYNGGTGSSYVLPYDSQLLEETSKITSQFSSICLAIQSGCSLRNSATFPSSFDAECFMEFDDQAPFGGTSHRRFLYLFGAVVIVRVLVELLRIAIVLLSWFYDRIVASSWSIDFVGISLGSPLFMLALHDRTEFFKVVISHQPTHTELIWRVIYHSMLCSLPLLAANLYFLFSVSQAGLKVLNMFSVLSAFVTVPLNVIRAVQAWRSLDQSFSTNDMTRVLEMSQNTVDADSLKLDPVAPVPNQIESRHETLVEATVDIFAAVPASLLR
jgi:Leucine-rich repeat (LRR) protein